MQSTRRNYLLEHELKKLEKKIGLLIANRTSIQELDREEKKKKGAKIVTEDRNGEQLLTNKKKISSYSNLFHLLQTEPVYLAALAYLMPRESAGGFIDKIIPTLYGDAFAAREEYLLLNLFHHAILKEVKHSTRPNELIQSESIIPGMVLAYSKRKQGIEYLRQVIGPVIKEFMMKDVDFEVSPSRVLIKQIKAAQKRQPSGNGLKRTVTEIKPVSNEDAIKNSTVKAHLERVYKQITSNAQPFLDAVMKSLTSLPYGLRLICKQLRTALLEKYPKATPDEIIRVLSYYVYYRFINLAIVTPDSFNIGGVEPTMQMRRNLIVLSKLLQAVFNGSLYEKQDELAPLNAWIASTRNNMIDFYKNLVEVSDPEDYLQVDKYNELFQQTKPFIIISVDEMLETHQLLRIYGEKIARNPQDPLRIILKEMGEIPTVPESQKQQELQLVLETRFKKAAVEKRINSTQVVYDETKEAFLWVLKTLPPITKTHTFMSLLMEAKRTATDQDDKPMLQKIKLILDNLKELEDKRVVSKTDNYVSFLRDVAREITHRNEQIESQAKEASRLRAALKNSGKYQDYINEQLFAFQKYLQSCRENMARNLKKKKKTLFKFTYKELEKKEVIIESEISPALISKVTFFVRMTEEGSQFDIEAKVTGVSVGRIKLILDELLEMKDNNETQIEIDNVVLSVAGLIYLINKLFLS
jgi:Ras GTPase-activating-like protein IQGAP2/3